MRQKVTIKVSGQTLTVTVDDNEKAELLIAAQQVDECCASVGSNDSKIKLLTAALTFAIELNRLKKNLAGNNDRLNEVISLCEASLNKNQPTT